MNNNIDIFDILGINGREDSFTDLLSNIFNKSEEFRSNLSKVVFDEKTSDIYIKIRSCYKTPNGKIIPDILLYTNNNFAIIEVKIFADEGWDQLKRYWDGRDIIQEQLISLHNNSNIINKEAFRKNKNNRKIYFLTLSEINEENISHKDTISITWRKIVDLIPNDVNDERLNICIKDLKRRIDEYENPEINLNDNFNDCFNLTHFVSGDLLLKRIFSDYKDLCEFWSSWENGHNRYSSTIQVNNNEWKSKNKIKVSNGKVIKLDEIHAKDNYDIHFEIDFYWEDFWKIGFRVDYHTNPYMPVNEIKSLGLGYLYNERKEIISKMKEKIKTNEKYEDLKDNLCSARGTNLAVYNRIFDIKKNYKVIDVKTMIVDEMKKTKPIIDSLLLAMK